MTQELLETIIADEFQSFPLSWMIQLLIAAENKAFVQSTAFSEEFLEERKVFLDSLKELNIKLIKMEENQTRTFKKDQK